MFPSNEDLEMDFTFETDRSGVVEEPIFKILSIGNWSGSGSKRPLSERRPIEIDRDNFDEVISRLAVSLQLKLSGGDVSLRFNSLDDFHPDEIFKNLDVFAELKDLRKRLKSSETFNSAANDVRSLIDIPSPNKEHVQEEAEVEHTDILDAILSRPDGGSSVPKSSVSSDISDLVSDLVRPHIISVDENEQSQMIAAVDSATGDLMRNILHHPEFQELESAWRGLHFLVRNTETSTELKIYILDVSKSEIISDLKNSESLASTALYRVLVHDTIETPGGERFALTLGNYLFEPSVDDAAAMIRLSKISAVANAPFISGISPELIGISRLSAETDAADWNILKDPVSQQLWAAISGQAEAAYLGLAFPRFLVRLPYGANTNPVDLFEFEEFENTPDHDQYLWANGCFVVGRLLAESFSEYGWKMGKYLKQDVDGLPLHIYKNDSEKAYKPCSEVLLSQTISEKLIEIGVMPLITFKNTDLIRLGRFHSVVDTKLKGMWD